jgi:uncharacterized protein YbgA (DUF1722 family)/uncharacterized protein YbbK (DUF523 family)
MRTIRLAISSCLLGERVRYDGQHKLSRFLRDTLGEYVDYVPVCPEVECGLPTPREAMRLVGDPDAPRLMTIKTGRDLTAKMLAWAEERLAGLEAERLSGFIFKSKSPSSGMERVKVYPKLGGENNVPKNVGSGLFAAAFMRRFPTLPVEEDGRLNDARLRENFIERIFVMSRWRELLADGRRLGPLVEFHTRHKLLLLSHSPKHYREMGQLVATGKKRDRTELFERYQALLMEGLKLLATPKKNANVLQHLMGYFKKQLSADEKQELLELIDRYRMGYIPLVVPVTLVAHYVRKYRQPYLSQQVYLNPHPLELSLRNHA